MTDTSVEGDEAAKKFLRYKYPSMSKTMGNFKLHVSRGLAVVFAGDSVSPEPPVTLSHTLRPACSLDCEMVEAPAHGSGLAHD